MRIASYTVGGNAQFGVVSEDGRKATDATAEFGSLRSVLMAGDLDRLKQWAEARTPDVDLASVIFQSPVPDATNVICIGLNFPKIHPVHKTEIIPDEVSLFAKLPGSLVGHNENMLRTPRSDTYDYEGEITVVIGREVRDMDPKDAADYVAGVTILNDGSVREWQAHSVVAGKNFRSASSVGPWMATLDEVPPFDQLHMKTWLNGHLVQDVKASEMVFDIPTILAYVSGFVTLQPGDIISTGSPERTPVPGRANGYLQDGDRVDIEIGGVGILSNPVINDPGANS